MCSLGSAPGWCVVSDEVSRMQRLAREKRAGHGCGDVSRQKSILMQPSCESVDLLVLGHGYSGGGGDGGGDGPVLGEFQRGAESQTVGDWSFGVGR